jgi:hypothetical protein
MQDKGRRCVLNFAPLFYVTHEELDTGLSILDEALSDVASKI